MSGHQLSAASFTLDVVDEDDVEGHTISLDFPRLEDAKQFEQRLIATGAIVGNLVVGRERACPEPVNPSFTHETVDAGAGPENPGRR